MSPRTRRILTTMGIVIPIILINQTITLIAFTVPQTIAWLNGFITATIVQIIIYNRHPTGDPR